MRQRLRRIGLSTTVMGLLWALSPAPAAAQCDITVSDVPGLKVAIINANDGVACPGPNTIDLMPGTYTLTTVDNLTRGPNGFPDITSEITIRGQGANATIIARDPMAPPMRFFHVTFSQPGGPIFAFAGQLTLEYLTLQDGNAQGTGSTGSAGAILSESLLTLHGTVLRNNHADVHGGAISARNTVNIWYSTLDGNTAGIDGGAIVLQGTLTAGASTFSGNTAGIDGGAISSDQATVNLMNVTLSGNTAGRGGGAIRSSEAEGRITSSTIYENRAVTGSAIETSSGAYDVENSLIGFNANTTSTGPNCATRRAGFPSAVTSLGGNIETGGSCNLSAANDLSFTELSLRPLANNGGTTLTHFPALGGPAVDHLRPERCPPPDRDQRGVTRPQTPGAYGLGSIRCDAGAVEWNPIGTLGSNGGVVAGTDIGFTVGPGVLPAGTLVSVEVISSLIVTTPPGFVGAQVTLFADFHLVPNPSPLPAPGAAITLPLDPASLPPPAPGTPVGLFELDPATAVLTNTGIIGAVDPGGTSATFAGVTNFSTFVGVSGQLDTPPKGKKKKKAKKAKKGKKGKKGKKNKKSKKKKGKKK